jgi:hypothetical protein
MGRLTFAFVPALLGLGCTAVVDAGSYEVQACDPFSNEGCEGGQSCFANVATNERFCTTAGTRGPGMLCSGGEDCEIGTTCVLYGPDRGICSNYCTGPSDCASQPDDAGCNYFSSTGLGFCYQGCDPSDPAACGAGVACYAMGTDSRCRLTGTLGLLEPCEETDYDNSCAPGYVCVLNNMDETRCFEQCGPGLPDCGTERTCAVITGPGEGRAAGSGEWGVCAFL